MLRVSARQVQRHAATGRVRSRREGRRLLLHAADVATLAQELGATARPGIPQDGEIVTEIGPVMELVRDLTGQLMVATRRVGELEGQLQHRLLPNDEANLRQQVTEYEARIAALEAQLAYQQRLELEREAVRARELARSQRPWWRNLFN